MKQYGIIIVEKRWRVANYYPVCDLSKKFAQLTKTTTLTEEHLHTIGNIGFKVTFKEKGSEQ